MTFTVGRALALQASRSAAGFRWNEALPTQPASIERSRSIPERAQI